MLTTTIATATDDFGPSQGQIPNGGQTDDPTPTFQISFSSDVQAGDTVTVQAILNNRGSQVFQQVVTSEDVARGYMLFTPPAEADGDYVFRTSITDPAGNIGPTSPDYSIHIQPDGHGPLTTTIVRAVDDSGANQGPIPDGGQTDDTTPTFQISFSSDVHAGDTVSLQAILNNRGSTVFQQVVTSQDVSRGFMLFTPPAEQDGHYLFRVSVTDTAGNIGPTSPDYAFDIQPDSGGRVITGQDGGSNLAGTTGDDTLIAGTSGPDTMTGGGGGDHFEFDTVPWQAATITDFTEGQDKIDVSHLLSGVGYTGSNPIADGYIKFGDDGSGNTWVYFDRDGSAGTADPWGAKVATLDHITASTVNVNDFIFTAASPPPPPPASPPPPPPPASGGQVITGHDGGSNMTGGSGDDTLIGGASGPDTMTGGGGGDHFEFDTVPWQAATITDFTEGSDKIDVSHLLAGVGYSGTDPIADGYIKFGDDGQGDTWIYFDRDGHGTGDQWGTKVATLDHVAASTVTASDFIFRAGAASPPPPPASPPPPPSSGGQVLVGQDGGSNLTGTSGDDTLIGGHGQDTMTGAAGADHFTWNDLPWAYTQITDFTEGSDKIDVSHLLSMVGYAGSDPIADGYIKFGDDGQGNTWIYFDRDGSAGTADPWGTHLATLQHVSAASLSASDFIFH